MDNPLHTTDSLQVEDIDIKVGDFVGERHKVIGVVGKGGFGLVTKCLNVETGEKEAIKITRNDPDILYQANLEIDILRKLQCLDPDACNIVRWKDFFFHGDNICLNFELLDQSLLDFIIKRQRGLSIEEERTVLHQMTTALQYLHSFGIIHADLKPDNVMIVDCCQQPLRVKLIDFGLAYEINGEPGVSVQAPGYSAPEVILGLPFNQAIDVWSLGVTAAEVVARRSLYRSDQDYDILSSIIEDQGQPSDDLLNCGKRTAFFFSKQSDGQPCWRFKTAEEFEGETACEADDTDGFNIDDLPEIMGKEHKTDVYLLVDLIKKMLCVDAEDRIKPLDVLQHPFFTQSLTQSPPENTPIKTDVETPPVCQQPDTGNISCGVDNLIPFQAAHFEKNYVDIHQETNITNTGFLDAGSDETTVKVDQEATIMHDGSLVAGFEDPARHSPVDMCDIQLESSIENVDSLVVGSLEPETRERPSVTNDVYMETGAKKRRLFRGLIRCMQDTVHRVFSSASSRRSFRDLGARPEKSSRAKGTNPSVGARFKENQGLGWKGKTHRSGFLSRLVQGITNTYRHLFVPRQHQQSDDQLLFGL